MERKGGMADNMIQRKKLRKIYKSIMDLKDSRRSPARLEKKKADTAHHRIRQHTHQEEMPKLRE
ncbi:hypothetical protein [Chromobacterium amazonense]|uniref:Uncharacterized protein n=1 Tax=Chromobacterium amazonense TaxID=1382803 RepID=A0ABU8UYT4_9NEIS|nr:hypothetical protein [Chromobacterium amazonense]MBM2885093.1 hypothetical protein [Chromobacterium amazonense]MDQ4539756.1 hypothetical protein [Chromobacterium amazonense]